MTLKDEVIKNIIRKLINGQDYRVEIINLINAEFLQFAIKFFKKVVDAKYKQKKINFDWYHEEFSDSSKYKPEEIGIHLGMNKKTVFNMHKSATKEIVIETSNQHYESFLQLLESLLDVEPELDLSLSLTFRDVTVKLNVSESFVVINALAVKRAALRGGYWSTAGKKTEKYLMKTLCLMFDIPSNYYDQSSLPKSMREVDFYLVTDEKKYRCEVKLMGSGNPESADAIFARDTDIFVGDKLSDLNKKQSKKLNTEWVELRDTNGFMKFKEILKKINIPHNENNFNIVEKLENVLKIIFS